MPVKIPALSHSGRVQRGDAPMSINHRPVITMPASAPNQPAGAAACPDQPAATTGVVASWDRFTRRPLSSLKRSMGIDSMALTTARKGPGTGHNGASNITASV